MAYDRHSHEKNFVVGDGVVVKTHCHNRVTWQLGIIVEKFSPDSYILSIGDGSHQKCHINQTHKHEILLENNKDTQSSTSINFGDMISK